MEKRYADRQISKQESSERLLTIPKPSGLLTKANHCLADMNARALLAPKAFWLKQSCVAFAILRSPLFQQQLSELSEPHENPLEAKRLIVPTVKPTSQWEQKSARTAELIYDPLSMQSLQRRFL